jgi:hypothetical protein
VLQLPINDESITWVCGEFLRSLDDPIYFTTQWTEYSHETTWVESKREIDLLDENQSNPHLDLQIDDTPGCTQSFTLSNPGILFPIFISNWIIFLSHRCHLNPSPYDTLPECQQLNLLVNTFISTVCGESSLNPLTSHSKFSSLCAIKWLFRVFSYPFIQRAFLFSGTSICTIGSLGVRKLITFVREKFSSMSQILTWQIYQGLIPFLLCMNYNDPTLESSSSVSLPPSLLSFFDIFQEFGLRSILQSHQCWDLLVTSITNSLSSSSLKFSLNDSTDARHLPILIGLIGSFESSIDQELFVDQMNLITELTQQHFRLAQSLYSTPYLDPTQQWSTLCFMDSVSSVLCSLINLEHSAVAEGSLLHVIYEDSYRGNLSLLLNGFILSVGDLSSYLSFLLLTTIHTTRTRTTTLPSTQVQLNSLSKFRLCVRLMTESLLLAFINPEISLAHFKTILHIHFETLRQLTTILRSAQKEEQQQMNLNSSSSSSFSSSRGRIESDLLIFITLSQFLHNFKCLMKILHKFQNHNSKLFQKFQTIQEEMPTLLTVFQVLSSSSIVSSSFFQSNLSSSTHLQESEGETVESISFSISHQYSSYGKYCDEMIGYRWMCLSGIMDLMLEIHLNTPLRGSQLTDTRTTVDQIVSKLLQNGIEEIELCSTHSITEVINTLRLLLHSLTLSHEDGSRLVEVQLIHDLIHSTWRACFQSDDLSSRNMKLFIQLVFSPEVMSLVGREAGIFQEYFRKILKYSMSTKPFILQFLLYHLTTLSVQSTTTTTNSLLSPFFSFFQSLLIYREPIQDDHSQSDEYLDVDGKDGVYVHTIYGVLEYGRIHNIHRLSSHHTVRVLLLLYLQHLQDQGKGSSPSEPDDSTWSLVPRQDLIRSLFQFNSNKAQKIFATVGSEKFGEKLRCWQSLCVLVHSVDHSLCQEIASQAIESLADTMAHGIRVHVEIFCAKLLEQYPEIVLPRLLDLLKKFNHPQQVDFFSDSLPSDNSVCLSRHRLSHLISW